MNESTQENIVMLLTIAEAAIAFATILVKEEAEKGEEDEDGKDECSNCLFKGMCHEAD